MSAHAAAGSGAVTISDEFIGSQVRRSPGSRAVNPSVARTTNRAVTGPRSVSTRPGRSAVTRVSS